MPNEKPFVHLHLHTEYSLLDGACRIGPLMERLKEIGQTAVAVTDHGVMYGCVDFFKAAQKAGVKPIIGCEVYVATRGRFDKVSHIDGNHHLVLLCKNETGYQNLIKLVSLGFTEGFYSKPRVDKELLAAHSEGLICLSACLAGEIPQALLAGEYDRARETALWFDNLFGRGSYYIELQDHGLPEQRAVLPGLVRLSEETGIPLVATNDAHYLRREDSHTQQVLMCIQTKKTLQDDDRMEFGTDEFYVKSAGEMYALFGDVPAACANTAVIAQQCQFKYTFGQTKLPAYRVPDGMDNEAYFRKLCREGLEQKYGPKPEEAVLRRLEYETGVISSMGYTNYYLIVMDFISYAKSKGIPVGPGRGSGAGSLAAYCMGITGVDPIKYHLIFERFLNPERVSMPDFDVDFCNERRGEVIDYVNRKYGDDHVAQIVTFGTLKSRAAIRDVGRVLGLPYQKVDTVAKMVPFDLSMTLDKALKNSKPLQEEAQNDPQVAQLLEIARKIEGMPRNTSTHAAGVVITPGQVNEYVPVSSNDGVYVTQFTMGAIEELGLLKIDILGLRNLTVIADAERMICEKDKGFTVNNIPYDDKMVFDMLSAGDTDGVFQLESGGMRQTLTGLRPSVFEDIIALISLYRPGPMEDIPTYIRNRHDPSQVRYRTEKLAHILDVTYGVIVYQEQVMQICRDLAGFSYGQADLVRRAMSKKKHDVMEKEREHFTYGNQTPGQECAGCVANGVPAEVADAIFNDMSSFASYGFNKSHAAPYAVVAYQTAWLKCRYPKEYMAALLTSVQGFGGGSGGANSKIIAYTAEANRLGIKVLPPDINQSDAKFTVQSGHIRYSLLALKNVGGHLIESVVAERGRGGPFLSLYNFCSRMSGTAINKMAVESLIKGAAFDGVEQNRRAMILALEGMFKAIDSERRRNIAGQINLFEAGGEGDGAADNYHLPQVDNYPKDVLLQQEKEVSGLYLSGHPLQQYSDIIRGIATASVAELTGEGGQQQDNRRVVLVCTIVQIKFYNTKSNDVMSFTTIEDLTGGMEALIFPKTLMEANAVVKENSVVVVRGRVSVKEEEEPKLIVEDITSIDSAQPGKLRAAGTPGREGLYLRIPSINSAEYRKVGGLLSIFEGEWPVYFRFADTGKMMRAPGNMWTQNNQTLLGELKTLLGAENVAIR